MPNVSMHYRRELLAGAGAAGAIALAGCAGGSDGGDVYEIGMIDAQTGSLSDFGERNQRGKDLALATVNEVGVADRELEIIVEDSESQSGAGVNAAQKLVNQDGVPLVIGAVGSGVSTAIYDSVIRNTDVVQISQNSTGVGLSGIPGLLRTCPSGVSQSNVLAELIAEDGYDDVALTYINNDFGESLADAFVDAYDGNVAFNNPHDGEQATYSGLLTQMNNSGADAWVFITYQAEFSTQVNEMVENGYDPQLYGADSNRGESVLENTPDGSMDGMKLVEPSAPRDQPNFQDFADRFQEEYDREPTSWAAFAYDAVITAALSIQAADEFTGNALREVVRDVTRPAGDQVNSYEAAHEILVDGGGPGDVDYQGVSGPLDLDENGDPIGSIQIFEVQDHGYVATERREG